MSASKPPVSTRAAISGALLVVLFFNLALSAPSWFATMFCGCAAVFFCSCPIAWILERLPE